MTTPVHRWLLLAGLLVLASEAALAWRMVALSDEVRGLRTQVRELEQVVADANDQLDNAQAAAENLADAVDELTLSIDEFERRDWREVLPVLIQAARAVQEDTQLVLVALDDPQAVPEDGPAAGVVASLARWLTPSERRTAARTLPLPRPARAG